MKTINIIKILGIIGLLFLLPSISNAQIQRVWSIAEYTSTMLPPPATGTKVAYRTLNNSLYYWNGSAWIRIAGPGIVDTSYSLSFSSPNLSLLGSGSSVSLTNLYTPGWGLLKTAEEFKVDSSKVASRYYAGTNPTTIAANYAAVSNGTNLIARNLFDNNTYAGVIGRPWKFGEYTTAGLPTGVTGYTVYETTKNGLAWYQGSRWAYALESTFARGTATRVPFFDANGQINDNSNLVFQNSNRVVVTPNGLTTNSIAQFGTIEVSSYALNNSWFGDNAYYTGAGFVRRATGYAGLFRFQQDEGQFWFFDTGSAGSAATPLVTHFKINRGFFAAGSAVSNAPRTATGATFMHRYSDGFTGLNTVSPSYFLDINSTNAIRIPVGTTAQTPTESIGILRYNPDSTAYQGYAGSSRIYFATRAYARSLVSSATWLKPQLEAGDVTINAASGADLKINNLDTAKFGSNVLRSWGNTLLLYNTGSGATGITSTNKDSYHTVINGSLSGSDGGTGQIIIGGSVVANSSGANFNLVTGYSSSSSSSYATVYGYNASVTADNAGAIGRNALADEAGEFSLGSAIYSKINLWTNTGDIFAKGDVIAEDSVKVTTRPSMPSATDIAVYDANGWLGYRTISSLADGNGIYSNSGTLANHTTRAKIPDDGNLLFSQLFNSSADSMYLYFRNYGSGERAFGFGLTDTLAGGYSKAVFYSDGTGVMNWEFLTSDGVFGNTTVKAFEGDLSLSVNTGSISLATPVGSEIRMTGLIRSKQEAYYEINSTSSPQTFSNTYSDNFVNQGSTQASFTFLFPASPEDGQILMITWGNAISVVTLDGNGNTITGTAVTTATAGTRRMFKFYGSSNEWVKIF